MQQQQQQQQIQTTMTAAVKQQPAAPHDAAASAAAQHKAALVQAAAALSPRSRTIRYYTELDAMQQSYARDLTELHNLLSSQRVTSGARERIASYQARASGVR